MLLIAVAPLSGHPQTNGRKYVRYVEKVREGSGSFVSSPVPSKTHRSSSKRGNINLIYDETLPDSIKTALNYAKNMWEAKIPTKQPIYIQAIFEPMEADIATTAEVVYNEIPDNSKYIYPSALIAQITDTPFGELDSPDGIVIFNSELVWNCSFQSASSTAGYNLPTMAMRGIARCLGFGSSVYEYDYGIFSFYNEFPSYFDSNLYVSQTCLSDLKSNTSEIAQFVTSNNVYYKTDTNSYKIYAPQQYNPGLSLCTVEDEQSLMSYSLAQGDVSLNIDGTTTDILRHIGWEFPTVSRQIKCNDIGEDGIGSSYTPHAFSLLNSEGISSYQWKFYLKVKTGDYKLVSTGNSAEFTIVKITPSDDLLINTNGDFEGRIECAYIENGTAQNAIPFSISLEQKPIILGVENLQRIYINDYDYYLMFNVNYVGADFVKIELEEDYSTTFRTYRIEEPCIAHVVSGNVSSLVYNWVTIKVANEYGSISKEIELEPVEEYETTRIQQVDISNNVCIYSLNGNMIFEGDETQIYRQNITPGIYIKKGVDCNGNINTSKIIVR